MQYERKLPTVWKYLLPPFPQYKMEAANSSETLVLIYQSTWNQSPGKWKSSSALL